MTGIRSCTSAASLFGSVMTMAQERTACRGHGSEAPSQDLQFFTAPAIINCPLYLIGATRQYPSGSGR
jgi:hypothetical protein